MIVPWSAARTQCHTRILVDFTCIFDVSLGCRGSPGPDRLGREWGGVEGGETSWSRAELVTRQREWATRHDGGVIEGRDIGSVVFPDADLKVYLDARPDHRDRR